MGSEFDTLFIVEAQDDRKVAEMVLAIAAHGYVRTRTHRLYNEAEYQAVISSLP